jgi:hypothetical protein
MSPRNRDRLSNPSISILALICEDKCPLCSFDFTLELAHGLVVTTHVPTSPVLVRSYKVINNSMVEIFTSKVRISGCREDLEDVVFDGEEAHIECPATKVIDENVFSEF